MIRALGIAAAALVVLLAAAILVAPSLVDWNAHRDEVGTRIAEALGRKVVIAGPLSMGLLPVPHLTAEQVSVGNIAGGAAAEMARIDRVELRLRPVSLLGLQFEVSSLVLAGAEIDLEKLADGRTNWRFVPATDSASAAAGPLDFPMRGRNLVLDRVEIRDSRISYRAAGRTALRAESVSLAFDADDAAGPFHLAGSANVFGAALAGDIRVGRIGAGESVPLDAALSLGDGAARLSLGGALAGKGPAATFRGRIGFKAADSRKLAASLGAPGLDLPAGAIALDSAVVATRRDVSLQTITLDLPGVELAGFAAVNIEGDPQIDLKLGTERFDLDAWLAAARAGASAAPPKPAPVSAATATAPPAGFALPSWLAASVDLTAESVVWRGGLLERARVNAALANGTLTLNQAGIALPGDAQLNLFGFLDARGGQPQFDGSIEAGAGNPRALLRWLGIDAAGVPADRLTAARLGGHILATPDRLRFDGAELRLDGSKIATALDLRLGGRPGFGLSFAADTINLDAYRKPAATSATPGGNGQTDAGAAPSPFAGLAARLIDGADGNVKGRVDQLIAGGVSAQDVELDGALLGGSVTLRSLSVGDIEGAQLSLSGKIDGIAEGALHLDGVELAAKSDRPARLLALAGIALPPERIAPAELTATLEGDGDSLSVSAKAGIAEATLALDGTVTHGMRVPALDLAVQADDASLADALRLVAPSVSAARAPGELHARFHLGGDPMHLALGDLHLVAGPLDGTGHADLALGEHPRLDASLNAGEVALGALLAPAAAANSGAAEEAKPEPEGGTPSEHYSRAPIALAWFADWDGSLALEAQALDLGRTRLERASLALSLGQGAARLDSLKAQLYGGDLTASGRLDAQGTVSLSLGLGHANLKDALIGVADLDLAEGTFDASADLSSSGQSLAEMIGRLEGKASIEGHDGTLRGFDLAAVNEKIKNPKSASLLALLQSGMRGGETRFESMQGALHAAGGVVVIDDLALEAAAGSAHAIGTVNLPAYAVNARAEIRFAGAPDAPPLVMRLAGPLDAPRRALDINALQTWLAARGG